MSIFESSESELITRLTQDEGALLKALDKGVNSNVFTKAENRDLYFVLKSFYLNYRHLPSVNEFLLYAQTNTNLSTDQKEKTPLYFQELLAEEPSSEDPVVLIDALIENYKIQEAKNIALRLADKASDKKIDKTLSDIINSYTRLKNMGTSGELVADYKTDKLERLKRYQKVKESKQDTGLYYCFPTLNKITGGQDPQTLWIVRGGPKAGKSTALINMSDHVARQGKNVIYFSAEVSKDVIERRLDAINTGLPMSYIKRGQLSPEEEEIYINYLSSEEKTRGSIIIVDKANLTTDSIRAQIREIRNKMPIDLIVVDYLGLIKLSYKTESKWIELGEVAKELRAIAKEENLPLLTAQQTNKKGDTANAQEIDRTCDLLFDLSRENPDEDTVAGANVTVIAKIVFSRDSGLGEFPIEAQFAYGLMKEIQTDYMM